MLFFRPIMNWCQERSISMKTSDNGRKFIEQFEGLFLRAYDDGTGVETIGYGHTTAAGLPRVVPGMTITEQQADDILSADLASVENDVNRLVTVPINQNQFDALVSFHFNTGALARSNVLRAINNKQFDAVSGDLNMWCHAGGRVLAGLVRRRKAEGVLFNSPYPPVAK
jgi:lysozyme